jgi:RNA methyltransferase, TrmH family
LIEGARSLEDALTANIKIEHVIVNRSFFQTGQLLPAALETESLILVDDSVFKSLSAVETPSGVLAIAETPAQHIDTVFKHKPPLVVIAENIQDPGNLGTMIRTSLAAQASGMLITTGSVDTYNPKVVRAAAGSLFALPIAAGLEISQAISICRRHQVAIYGCDPAGNTPYWKVDYTSPIALVFGNEGHGCDSQVLDTLDGIISIPMNPASESLNVSVCAGIVLFAAAQQRIPATHNKIVT